MPFKFRISTLEAGKNDYPRGKHYGNWAGLSDVERKLISDNIKWGVNVFGIIGTMVLWQTVSTKNLVVPVPSLSYQVLMTNGGQHLVEPALSTPVPTLSMLTELPTVGNAGAVVSHDDDPPLDVDKTAEANSDPVVDQSWLSNVDNKESITGTNWRAVTFTPNANHTIKGVRLNLYGSGATTITVSIRATAAGLPTEADLCSGTFDGSQLNSSADNRVYDISLGAGTALTAGTVYAIVVRVAAGTLYWGSSGAGYAGGQKCSSSNSGSSWTADATRGLLFEEYGANSMDVPATPNPSAVGDGLYIGNSSQFDYVDVWVNQAGVGTYTITWKYWDGVTWSALTMRSNDTNNWKRSGRHTVNFIKPGNWQTTTILGSDFYWIKAEVATYTNQTTQPLLGRVWIGAY